MSSRMTETSSDSSPEKPNRTMHERKLRKPLIEKKRRERINSSLDHLKTIMVHAYNLDQSKLEKADVLEITVQHMENLQRTNVLASTKHSVAAQQRYSSGYIRCMHEVHGLLLTSSGVDKNVGAHLLNHLLTSLPQTTRAQLLPAVLSPSPAPTLTAAFQNHARKSSLPSAPCTSPRPIVEGHSGRSSQPSPSTSRRTNSPRTTLLEGLVETFNSDPRMWRPW